MSESKTTCPDCGRAPGSVHDDPCPRSRKSQARLRFACLVASMGRQSYPGVGLFSGRRADGKEKHGINPGVPFVGGDKPRTAGGLPRGTMSLPIGPPEPFDPDQRPTQVPFKRAEMAKVFLEDWGHVGRPQQRILRPGVGARSLIVDPRDAT